MRSQHLKFDFEECRQDLGARHTPINVLTRAENIYRSSVKAAGNGRVLAKRKSYTRQSMTFSGGSLSGEPEKILPGIGSSTYMRDTGGQNWIQNGTAWEYKSANAVRPWVDTTVTNPNDLTTPRPAACLVGTKLWQFATVTDGYQVNVFDITTGAVSTAPFSVTATGIANLAPVYDGTDLWVLWVTGTGQDVKCHKFASAAITSSPTATVFYDTAGASGVVCNVIDAKYMSGVGKTLVVFGGGAEVNGAAGNVYGLFVGYLNTSTGTASTSPAVTMLGRQTENDYSCGMGAVVIAEGQETFVNNFKIVMISPYFQTGVANQVVLTWVDLNPSTFAVYGVPLGSGGRWQLLTGISGSTRWGGMLAAVATTDTHTETPFSAYLSWRYDLSSPLGIGFTTPGILKYSWTGSVGTMVNLSGIEGWVASKPVLYGGEWYFLTGHDDSEPVSSAPPTQQGYFLRKFSTGEIVAMFSMGLGAAWGHRVSGLMSASSRATNAMSLPPLIAYGTKLYGTVATTQNIGYVALLTPMVDMAHAYGKPVQAMGYGFVPGNIPTVWGKSGAHESAPIVAPYGAWSLAAGTETIAIRYAIRDADNTIWRSAPKVINSVTAAGASFEVQSASHVLPGTKTFIEVYACATGVPKLQLTVSAEYSTGIWLAASWVTVTLPATFIDGESLDTFGGAIEQTWPIQCQAVGYWKNRVFLAQKNRLFYSQELSQGLGPLFNEDLSSIWSDIDGDINVIGAINWDYQALYADSRIGVISGSGPDGAGRGNFIIQTLPTRSGVTMANCGAVGQGPGGSYFQDSQTGRICLTTPSLQIVEVDIGVRDYESTASPVKWIEHLGAQRSMLMGAQFSGYYITAVIDYGHPTEACPYGQNYAWASGAGITMRSAVVDSSGLLMIDSDGATRRISASSYAGDISSSGAAVPYGMWIRTGRLLPTGIQGEFSLVELKVLASIASASSCKMGITGAYDDAVSAEKLFDVTSSAYQFGIKPYGAGRIQHCEVQIIERAPNSGVYNQAFYIEGLALEIISRNKLKTLSSGRVL